MTSRQKILSICLAVIAVVFVLDLVTPLGVVSGVLYVAAVLVAMWSPKRSDLWLVATVCSLLIVVGAFVSPYHETMTGQIVANRSMAVLAIASTVMAALGRKQLERKLEDSVADSRSEQKRAEKALRDAEARYHSLLESLPLNVFQKDSDGKLLFGNQRYFETLGQTPENVIGKTDEDLFRPISRRSMPTMTSTCWKARRLKTSKSTSNRMVRSCTFTS